MEVITPLTVEKVVYGGEGLCRHEGKVIFVPFTIKGEQISAKISKSKKNFSLAQCLRVIHKDDARIDPKCCHFGFCGGCQFQHMTYEKQLETKTDILKENMRHFFEPAALEVVGLKDCIWEYREHIKLSFNDNKLGYHGLDDKNVFELKMCPIFSTILPSLLDNIKDSLNEACVNHAEVRLLKSKDSFIICIKIDHGKIEPLEQLLGFFQGVSIVLNNHRHDFGNCHIFQNYLGHDFETDIWSFMQNHRKMAELLYNHVLNHIPDDANHVVDLYCGAGILSILSALKGVKHVTGIELNPASIACAKLNLKLAPQSHLEFIAAPAEKAEKHLKIKPDYIIVNPPREGLSQEMLNALTKLDTSSICYVSCNPTTLSRDLKLFNESGYYVDSCKGFDLFPQTTHLETVCVIKKR
jgi:23S rRNA (uracil1939-C5)-methyltransferase